MLQIQGIDEEIAKSEESLSALNKEVEEFNTKIKNVENELKEKQREYDAQKKLTDERMIAICEQGELQYLDILLGSTNIIDFVSKYYLVSQIYENDLQLLEKANSQKKEIEAKTVAEKDRIRRKNRRIAKGKRHIK